MAIGMRVLVATDGSAHAWHAVRLAAAFPWPDGSVVRLVTALAVPASLGARTAAAAPPADPAGLTEAAEALRRPGLTVETAVLEGAPAEAIADDVAAWGGDLVIVGSRGQGALRTLLLGSVAAAVVDRAPCPVLVARGDSVRSIVLADDADGQPAERRPGAHDRTRFAGALGAVVGVAHALAPLASGIALTMRAAAAEAYAADLEESRALHRKVLAEAVADLRSSAVSASEELREGDPGHEVVAAASEAGADLIVVGTRGRTGIPRALLGSVARHVLVNAPCSVLVARAEAKA